MSTIGELIQDGFAHQQAGRLEQAERVYRQILSSEPRHAAARHLLGLLALQRGQLIEGAEQIRQAIDFDGSQPAYHANLGAAYRALGRYDDAAACYQRALALKPDLPEAHNNLGTVYQSQGRLDEALACYRRAVALRSNYAEAHHNAGTVLQSQGELPAAIESYLRAGQCDARYLGSAYNLAGALESQGRLDEACAVVSRLIEANRDDAQAHFKLAGLLKRRGDLAGAEAEYKESLRAGGDFAEAYNDLGNVYKQSGQAERAAECYRAATRLDPAFAPAHHNLGAILLEQRRPQEAVASCRAASQINPQSPGIQFQLGISLAAAGDLPGALAAYREALRLKPDFEAAMTNCTNLLASQGHFDEALALLDSLLAREPGLALAHFRRANLLKITDRLGEAIAAYQAALRVRPNYPEAHTNLAALCIEYHQPEQAIECCQQGLQLAPDTGPLYNVLAVALARQGRADEAIAAHRRAIALQPDNAVEHSNLLYALNYLPLADPDEVFAEHRAWAARHAEPLTARAEPHANDRSPDRRLRVGYVSAHFRQHAINYFSEPILASHDHERFEIFCYSDVAVPDRITQRLTPQADHWRNTTYDSHEVLARRIRDDKIDILVDLAGHIGGNRLLVFARKPAPVQVTYLGYQNTTGMTAMDYRLTDERADPPGATDRYYTEKLVRLPRAFFCYRPADDAPDLAPLPAASAGCVTFGAFNHYRKVMPRVIDTWLSILSRVSGSRLLLLANRGGYVEEKWRQLADQRGIAKERIELLDYQPTLDYLKLIQRSDIALDPFPFNGHTTTCDAIWQGVPVVMLEGNNYVSRFGGSVLANVGLEALIAKTVEQYIETAVRLASDLESLAALRAGLRARMAASPIMDFAGFTRHLEAAYRRMWHAWCAGDRP